MKKIALIFFVLCFCMLSLHASDELTEALPLLQMQTRTPEQTQQVLQLFTTSKQPRTVFAAGASLVRVAPSKIHENALLNVFLNNRDPLKQFFAAVILTAMGSNYPEFSQPLQEALSSQDPALRAYAAGAYTILNPQQTQYSDYVVHLYIFDPSFAQRTMNLISQNDKQTLRYLKQAAGSSQAQIRAAAAAWLGDLQNKKAASLLLRMANKETDTEAASALAQALAKNRSQTLQKAVKKLSLPYQTQPAATYALALGFMTGNAIEPIKQALLSSDKNTRINAARAAAYMAGVLGSDRADLYSRETTFDIFLLKGLIALLSAQSQTGSSDEKVYAQNALTQIAKLN